MRFGEKSALVSVCSLLICLSISAQLRLLQGAYSTSSPIESQIGFYVPFAAFALLSAYHYFEWARTHKFQAIVLMICLVSIASLLGLATGMANPSNLGTGNTHSAAGVNFGQFPSLTGQSGVPPAEVVSIVSSLQENLQNLGKTINSTPYASTIFVAIEIGTAAIALGIILLRGHYRRFPSLHMDATNEIGGQMEHLRRPPLTPRELIVEEYLNTLGFFKGRGLGITDADTPHDALRRVKQTSPERSELLRSLTYLYEEAKFSLHQITESYANSASKLRISITGEVPKNP
jgi:hypothetical protein